MKNSLNPLPASIKKLSILAESASFFGILLFIGFGIYVLGLLLSQGEIVDVYLNNEFFSTNAQTTFNPLQRWLAVLLASIPAILGVWILWTARCLFCSYRKGEIFTLENAERLKKIGWGLVFMAPLSIILSTLSEAIFSSWLLHSLQISIGVEAVEIFTFIFGLLFTVIAQIMFEATRLETENKSFV